MCALKRRGAEKIYRPPIPALSIHLAPVGGAPQIDPLTTIVDTGADATRIPLRCLDEITLEMRAKMPEFNNPQDNRIRQVFGTKEIPRVNADTLQTYFNYLKENLDVPCLLTGIESLGYFGWEARYSFGYGDKADYERLRKKEGSYKDKYELSEFDATLDVEWDILVNVKRIPYRKRFTIPLSELQAVDKTSKNYQLLNDYTVWFINWR